MIEITHKQGKKCDFGYWSECWQKVLARKEVGFPQIPQNHDDWRAIDERISQCRDTKRVLVLGIGGSSLGTQVIEEAFRNSAKVPMMFLESPSPHVWQSWLKDKALWKDSHIVIVSKSGNTLETLSWVERLNAELPGVLSVERTTVITSPVEGALQAWAKNQKIPTLWIPNNVGGRFSVLTAAGMFPAGLMGLDLKAFRQGAEWALKNVELASELAAESALGWEQSLWLSQMWTYSESLKFFGEWWQQLWSESLGKRINRQGKQAPRVSTPMACRGPRDQHSLVQQLIEGPLDKNVFVTRVSSVENQSDSKFLPKLFPQLPIYKKEISLGQVMEVEAEAFEKSLLDAQLPFTSVRIQQLNEKSLAALFMLWQMTVAQLGEHLAIDAFNQPGVELGKRHAHQLLKV